MIFFNDLPPIEHVQYAHNTHTQISGQASWYGSQYHGRTTASGEIFNMYSHTAAHKTLPFGTKLCVENNNNNKSVVVTINDRGPFIGGRSLDLSRAAMDAIGGINAGVIPYTATTDLSKC